jgi:hypothetical protein
LAKATSIAGATTRGWRLIKLLQSKINTILTHTPLTATPRTEQRMSKEEQRVIDKTPIITIPHITDEPPIMQARNPTSKRTLKTTPQVHRRVTRNNTPGRAPLINNIHPIPAKDIQEVLPRRRMSPQNAKNPKTLPNIFKSISSKAQQRSITQQAINVLTIQKKVLMDALCTPRVLMRYTVKQLPPNFEHYANLTVHPITSKTIFSYKKLMHDPAMVEI